MILSFFLLYFHIIDKQCEYLKKREKKRLIIYLYISIEAVNLSLLTALSLNSKRN